MGELSRLGAIFCVMHAAKSAMFADEVMDSAPLFITGVWRGSHGSQFSRLML